MSDTSNSSESRSKWNPFQKVISMMTGRSGSTSSSSRSAESDKVVYRWTASCLNTTCPIFSKNPQFNMIYAPAPSLLMFTVVMLSSENGMTKTLQKLFELNDGDIDEIREMSCKLNDIRAPKLFYFFVRFLVDEEKTTTVCKELMTKSNDVANQQVFASIRPSRAIKFLSSLTFTNVTMTRPSLLTTNGYGSAGLNAKWIGKTRKAGLHRFAATYSKKKMEPFFEIRTSYKRVTMKDFEAIEVPFKVGRSQGSLILLRPHFIGHLPYANNRLSTEMLCQLAAELSAATWQQGRLLLPQFGATCQHDLWKNLMRHGVQPDLGQSQKAPPMASLWHWASLHVSSDGIGGQTGRMGDGVTKRTASQKALEVECRGRISGESLFKAHRTYSVRLDSPFTYLIQIDSIPIFTGSWFGSPAPKPTEIFVNAPERILHRRNSLPRKKRVKETRKQKLLKKIQKSEEKEREKDRKRAKKERFSSDTESLDSSTTSTATSSQSSSQSTSRSEHSERKPPSKPKESEESKKPTPKKEEAEPKSKKSKSNGWRTFANRIFGKKK